MAYKVQFGDMSIEAAVQCFKKLEDSIKYSNQDELHRTQNDSFILETDKVKNSSDTEVLFEKLRLLEMGIEHNKFSENWQQWRRLCWGVMMDPDSNLSQSVTRFIIALNFMEESLLPEAFIDSWKESVDRDLWLEKCNSQIDPFMKFSFYDELFLSHDDMTKKFGYKTLQDYIKKLDEVISVIDSAATRLETATWRTGIADTTASGAGIASGVLTGVGLILAPFTGFASLVVTGVGIGLGAGSAGTAIGSSIAQGVIEKNKISEVKESTEKITAETMVLTNLIESYKCAIADARSELDKLGTKASDYIKLAGRFGSGCQQLYRLVSLVKPGLNISHLLKDTSLAAKAAKLPGMRFTGLTANAAADGAQAMTPVAYAAGGALSVLSIGFGIWGTINGAKKLKEGSKIAEEFRKLVNCLTSSKRLILDTYGIDI